MLDDLGDPDRSPRASWFARVAHLVPWFLSLYVIFKLATYVGLIAAPGWLSVLQLALPMIIVLAFSLHAEVGRLCLRCMQDVPADASVRAQRKRWQLWIYHRWWVSNVGFILITLVASFLPYLVLGTVYFIVIGSLPPPPSFGLHLTEVSPAPWVNVVYDTLLGLILWSVWKHHRYRPWCPYCKDWGDGGEHEHVPDPDTVGTKNR